jgi:hypothetical protein
MSRDRKERILIECTAPNRDSSTLFRSANCGWQSSLKTEGTRLTEFSLLLARTGFVDRIKATLLW